LKISGRIFFLVVILSVILMLTFSPINDPDFWWHLRTGQWILENQAIPMTDPFSYTANGSPWIAHEWLSDLFIYSTYRLGGFRLLTLAFSLIIFGAFLFVYLCCVKRSRPYIAGLLLLLGAAASMPLWGIRPQMISLLFSSVLLFLLDRYQRTKQIRYLVLVPILMLAWVNSHGGYLLGLGILALYILGLLFDLVEEKIRTKAPVEINQRKQVLFLGGAFLACLAAAFVNPYNVHILIYPFQTLTDSSMQQFIVEWFSPDFHQLSMLPFAVMLLFLVLFGLLGSKRVSTPKILLTLAFSIGALISVRHIPLFVVVVIPVLAEQISSVVTLQPEEKENSLFYRFRIPEATSILLAALLVVTFIRATEKHQKVEETYFPQAAADWVLRSGLHGNLFSSYTWSGYLIWKLYPQQLVYIDGRMDVYSDDIVMDYQHIYYAYPDWRQLLEQRPTTLVLVEPDSKLASAVNDDANWEPVYQDSQSVIYSRK